VLYGISWYCRDMNREAKCQETYRKDCHESHHKTCVHTSRRYHPFRYTMLTLFQTPSRTTALAIIITDKPIQHARLRTPPPRLVLCLFPSNRNRPFA
jgi:hypothetical protein